MYFHMYLLVPRDIDAIDSSSSYSTSVSCIRTLGRLVFDFDFTNTFRAFPAHNPKVYIKVEIAR